MRSPQGKLLSWILFAVLIVGVFVLLWLWQQKNALVPTAPSTPSTPQAEEAPKKPFKGFTKEVLTEEEKATADTEALNLALRGSGDCASIVYDEVLRQSCLDTFNYDQALRNNDEALCGKIQDKALRTDCLNKVLLTLATQGANLALCDKISDDKLKQNCKDQIQAQMGRTATSTSTCDSIKDATLKQSCLDNFNFSKSVQTLTAQTCDTIQDSELKSRCSKTVAKNLEVIELGKTQLLAQPKTTEQKLQGCAALTGAEADACKDQLNFSLAAEKKDLAYCNLIKNATLQKNCVTTQSATINRYYLRLATARKDPSLCSKILDEGLRALCVTNAQ